jgi:molybdenum-dependent DNA-binding transcriptional regulator ModE
MDAKPVRTEIVMVYWDCGLHGAKGHLHQSEDVALRCMQRGAASKERIKKAKGISKARRFMALRLFLEKGSFEKAGKALDVTASRAREMVRKAAVELDRNLDWKLTGGSQFVYAALQDAKKSPEVWLKEIDKVMKVKPASAPF